MNDIKNVVALSKEEDCPADALMLDYRKYLQDELTTNHYPKHTEVTKEAIKYWMNHADYYEETDNNITFMWDEIPEEELPPLKIKLFKQNDKWYLLYLKEYGEDQLLIQGKQRKGKNKFGTINLDKQEESGRKK